MKEEKRRIGEAFKTSRTGKGISIEKASRDTRIAQRYIKAIEEEKFSEIPGEVVLKGFLRIYADYLHLDPRHLMSELSKKLKKEERIYHDETPEETKKYEVNKMIVIAGAAVAVIIAIVFITISFRTLAGYLKSADKKATLQKISESVSGDRLELRATILQETWVHVRCDDREIFMGTLTPGQERTWTAKEKISVKIGNAAGVKITSGGEVLLYPGDQGQVISREFTK